MSSTSTSSIPTGRFEERLLHELREVVAERTRVADAARLAAAARRTGRRPSSSSPAGGGRRRRRRRAGRLRLPLAAGGVVVACAAATLGGLALAGTLSDTAINPQAWVDGQRVQPAAGTSADQTAVLGILRRPRVASDALPPEEAQTLSDSPAAANGANGDLSRRAQGFTSGAAWIVPGDGRICFLYDNPPAGGGGTCQPDASIADNDWPVETGSAGSAPGLTSVAGVVPDGVTQVTLAIDGGGTVTAPVHENVYMTTIHGGLASLSYDGPDGPVTLGS